MMNTFSYCIGRVRQFYRRHLMLHHARRVVMSLYSDDNPTRIAETAEQMPHFKDVCRFRMHREKLWMVTIRLDSHYECIGTSPCLITAYRRAAREALRSLRRDQELYI